MKKSTAICLFSVFFSGCPKIGFIDPAPQRLTCIGVDGKPFFDSNVTDIAWAGDNVSFNTAEGKVQLHVPSQVCAVTNLKPAPVAAPAPTAPAAAPVKQPSPEPVQSADAGTLPDTATTKSSKK